MGTYDAEMADAQADIAAAGEAVTLVRYTAAVPDPLKPWEPGAATREEQSTSAVFLNYNMQSSGEAYANGTLIHTGDKKVLMAGLGLGWAPALQCEVIRADGSVWKIVNVRTLDPNGQKILHTLQVRQ